MLTKTSYKLQQLKWQLMHVFRFRRFCLTALDYEQIVLRENGFLLLYWKTDYASYLYIPTTSECIFKTQGVVLIKLSQADNFLIQLRNTWHKENINLNLQPVNIKIQAAKETIVSIRNLSIVNRIESSLQETKLYNFSISIKNKQLMPHQFTFSIKCNIQSLKSKLRT